MKKRRKVAPKSQVTSTRATGKNSPTDSPSVTRDQETTLFEASVSQHPDQRKLLSSLSYNKNLLKYLNDDRARQTSFCDLLIIVEGKEFRVHKVVVAVGSSYFHACLSKNPLTQVVTLDHVSSSVFQHLLHFLYTSEFLVWDNEISLVLEAARFLDIIDAVKLLAVENIAHSAIGDESLPTEDESTSNTETPNICPACGRNFCYRKTLDNHMNKAHGLAKTSDILNDDPSTRKSTRKRKSPVKFENGEERDKETLSSDESSNGGHDRTVSGREMDEEVLQIEEDDAEETSGGDEGQSSCDLGDTVDGNPNLNTSGNYPDGLAPIVLQDSSKKELKCPKCGKVFDRIGKYESHTRVHTGEKPFECNICQQRYSTKSNLTVHRKRHNSDTVIPSKEHKCPFCSKLHASRKTLVKHIRRFHPENAQEFLAIKKITNEGWKCDICNKTFTRRPHLEEHMILHSQDKPFKCIYCDEKFKSRFKRLKHQEKFHLGPFPCGVCGRQFNDSGNLKRHIDYTHGGKRKWTCFVCGKSVRERTTLKEHMRIHSGEKPHLCSICGQSFRHGSSYRLHLRVHHEDKRYECEECGKTFIRHDHLTKHKKIHSGEKAHQCEECGKCFGRRDHLTVHYKSVHLGEKVWQKYKATFHQCEVCKKVFKGKSSLEMHFRTHSGEKPYKCQICNQSFRIKKTLTKHLVIHSDARPFNCQHCNATFKRKDKLKYHIDHVHGAKTEQEMHEEPKRDLTAPEKAVPERAASKKAVPERAASKKDVPERAASKKAVPERPASKKAAPERTTFEKVATERAVSEKAVPGRTFSDGTNADIYVPLTLVPFEIAEMDGELERHVASSVNPSQAEYQRTPDIAFLEKYTLTPQPATLLHPVRAEQILEGREHSYLGILLGLDPQHPVQGLVTGENH